MMLCWPRFRALDELIVQRRLAGLGCKRRRDFTIVFFTEQRALVRELESFNHKHHGEERGKSSIILWLVSVILGVAVGNPHDRLERVSSIADIPQVILRYVGLGVNTVSVHATERERPLYEVLPTPLVIMKHAKCTRLKELLHLVHCKRALVLWDRHGHGARRVRRVRGSAQFQALDRCIERGEDAIGGPALVPLLLSPVLCTASGQGLFVLDSERLVGHHYPTKIYLIAHWVLFFSFLFCRCGLFFIFYARSFFARSRRRPERKRKENEKKTKRKKKENKRDRKGPEGPKSTEKGTGKKKT
jgi:hypothetical protein